MVIATSATVTLIPCVYAQLFISFLSSFFGFSLIIEEKLNCKRIEKAKQHKENETNETNIAFVLSFIP
jgi:hypothetical protein